MERIRLSFFTSGYFGLGGACDAFRLETPGAQVTVGLSGWSGGGEPYLGPQGLDAEILTWDRLTLAFRDAGQGRLAFDGFESSAPRAPYSFCLRNLAPARPAAAHREWILPPRARAFEAA